MSDTDTEATVPQAIATVHYFLWCPEGRVNEPVEGQSGRVYGVLLQDAATGKVGLRLTEVQYHEAMTDLFAYRRRHGHLVAIAEVSIDGVTEKSVVESVVIDGLEVPVADLLSRLAEQEKVIQSLKDDIELLKAIPVATTVASETEAEVDEAQQSETDGEQSEETPEPVETFTADTGNADAAKTAAKKATAKKTAANKPKNF